MRKIMLFLLLISLLVLPGNVQAQGNVVINELSVQLWPEYDHPEMLVMYSFMLAEESVLPAEVEIRIPANANLNAVAKVETDSMVNVPYDAPVKEGDWVIITMPVDDLAAYRVEYYVPIDKNGATRSYDFVWESDYVVNSAYIQFQQPPGSSNFSATPQLPNSTPANGGIVYHDLALGELAPQSELTLSLSYDKDNDDLTVSSMPVEVGGGDLPETNEPTGSFSAGDTLPFILVGVGILLIAGGLVYFFTAGKRDTATPKKSRKRHTPRAASDGGNIYCHECGSRASGSDKFCRSCGAKLRA